MASNRPGACALLLMAAIGAGACSSGSGSGTIVNVTASDFAFKPQVSSVAAGTVSFQVTNRGGYGHEMAVVKAASASDLPTKADGEVDESALPGGGPIAEVTAILPGQTKTLKVKLAPGKYILFCNAVDSVQAVHFKRGMYTSFTVTGSK